MSEPQKKTLQLDYNSETKVLVVKFNRPNKGNAMNMDMFRETLAVFTTIKNQVTGVPRLEEDVVYNDKRIGADADIRCVVIAGNGKNFQAGIDVQLLMDSSENNQGEDPARTAIKINYGVQMLQSCLTAIEDCPVPVIAAIHGNCIGLAVDLIATTDIRLASKDSIFSIREVDMGLGADVGTLQRLPFLVNNSSRLREWIFTSRNFTAQEAYHTGLISSLHDTPEAVQGAALDLAKTIASKSPVAVFASKLSLNKMDKWRIREGLEHIATVNSAMLQASDPQKAVMAAMSKKKGKVVKYSKL